MAGKKRVVPESTPVEETTVSPEPAPTLNPPPEQGIHQNELPLESEPVYDLYRFKNIVQLIQDKPAEDELKPEIIRHIQLLKNAFGLQDRTILFLYDPKNSINDHTADTIYRSLPKESGIQLLLVVNSPGGSIEPAYLISKCCREYSEKFSVCIPRKAKSAATLISLGAHEIHMGVVSELGPIDPQFGGLPALGLSNAVERMANLCKKYPEASHMFAEYLGMKLDLRVLGYFERVSESAAQYAERLLADKQLPTGQTPNSVADRFVYTYKDHSFVIDKDEAKQYLGDMVKISTKEYDFGNSVHNFIDNFNLVLGIVRKKNISIVGSLDYGIVIKNVEQKES